MRIAVRLMGVLKDRTPAGGALELANGATIDDALRALAIPVQTKGAITVNGRFERDRGRTLAPGDELVVIPPVGGG